MTKKPQENAASNLDAVKIKWFHHRLSTWGTQNLRDFPWRQTCDSYAILVAEHLLQKTDAITVVPIYKAFLFKYPTLENLVKASIDELNELLKPLGLYFRAERLYQCARIIIEQYGGKIPNSEKQLLELPGIGKYTARAICSQAFSQPLAVLDTNVARILERFFGLQGERVKSRCKILWRAAETIAPDKEVGKWNLTLLDFGAMVCRAKNPLCNDCPLSAKCDYVQIQPNDSKKILLSSSLK
ncbi:A/G-specific adenine glycosylase [Dendronalium sp. ChiSLP03b]|uniref:A/G-specific adenine glycosylase n=1 Tax=Dendronalium sp. ChiSLP03b TaxID=3075381 RepID=UPI002AD2E70C|nr:A/G-specific adenine glycosylase [Dendronalium sp. ChiSLP03b]MDZ8204427.1 A/G-specific adenine glycosylase [Dendronalium sp. ChiSLP03b]